MTVPSGHSTTSSPVRSTTAATTSLVPVAGSATKDVAGVVAGALGGRVDVEQHAARHVEHGDDLVGVAADEQRASDLHERRGQLGTRLGRGGALGVEHAPGELQGREVVGEVRGGQGILHRPGGRDRGGQWIRSGRGSYAYSP